MTPQQLPAAAKSVLDFWFDTTNQPYWFAKNAAFDATIRRQFGTLLTQAGAGELADWRVTLEGRLAEIIVLDQFSRNSHRDSAQAFAYDGMALILSQELVNQAGFSTLDESMRNFALMPMMHSESATIHKQALPLFKTYASADTLAYEHKHKAIIDRFGRYPHRNTILGRESSDEEIEFLKQPDSSF